MNEGIFEGATRDRSFVAALINVSADHTLSHNTWVKVSSFSVKYDEHNLWNPIKKAFVIPKGYRYAIARAKVRFSDNTSGQRQLEVRLNGGFTGQTGTAKLTQPATASEVMIHVDSHWIPVKEGDYIEMWVLQTSGTTLYVKGDTDYNKSCTSFSIELR